MQIDFCTIFKYGKLRFISKQFFASLNTLLYNMLKEIIQKAVIPAVHIKAPSLFRARTKSRTPACSGSQAYW